MGPHNGRSKEENPVTKSLSLLAVALVLTACGGGDGGDTAPASALDKYVGAWNFSHTDNPGNTPSTSKCAMDVTRTASEVQAQVFVTCRAESSTSVLNGFTYYLEATVDTLGNVGPLPGTAGMRMSGSLSGSAGSGTWVGASGSTASGTWAARR